MKLLRELMRLQHQLGFLDDDTLRDVAIGAFPLIPDHDEEKFQTLATLIKMGRNRNSAIRAMRQEAAVWELEGPRMTGPITSLKILGNFSMAIVI